MSALVVGSTGKHPILGYRGSWKSVRNQRKFLDWFAKEMKITNMSDWYSYRATDVINKGGGSMLHYYNRSLSKALATCYPEYKWEPWKFAQVPRHCWKNSDNTKAFLDSIAKKVGIGGNLDYWYLISTKHFRKMNGTALLKEMHGMRNMLSQYFPSRQWEAAVMNKPTPSKSQLYLWKMLYDMFPNATVHSDYNAKNIRYKMTSRYMQLDVYIPEFKLAFEYQGSQHYTSHFMFGDPTQQQKRDLEKKEAINSQGITIIYIPYWWDMEKESLQATIHKYRPDVIPNTTGIPIQETKFEADNEKHNSGPIYLGNPLKWNTT